MGGPHQPLCLTWLADDIIIIIIIKKTVPFFIACTSRLFSNKNKSAQCNIGNMFRGQLRVCFASRTDCRKICRVRILPVFILACWRCASGRLANVFHYLPALHSLSVIVSAEQNVCLCVMFRCQKKGERKISYGLLFRTWSFTALTNLFLMVALRPRHSSERHFGEQTPREEY